MRLTAYGTGTVLACLGLAVAAAAACYGAGWWAEWPFLAWLGLIPAILFLWVLWFFRDPDRTVPDGAGLLVSPADGTVTHIDKVEEPDFIQGPAWRCSIFLSVFDVHLNRAPAGGTVSYLRHKAGRFVDARREDSAHLNEFQDLGLLADDPAFGERILVRQTAGKIARRIVCPAKEGDRLARGERYGMIRFGSRTTVFLTASVNPAWRVKAGDKVKAGETILATAEGGMQ